jgi:hypothetical protein
LGADYSPVGIVINAQARWSGFRIPTGAMDFSLCIIRMESVAHLTYLLGSFFGVKRSEFELEILIFKGLTALRLHKSFGVKGLIR